MARSLISAAAVDAARAYSGSPGWPRLRAAAITVLGLTFGPPAGAAPLPAFGGTLHAPASRGLFATPGVTPELLGTGAPIGGFQLYADTDLRLDPRAATLSTDAGDWLLGITPETPRLLQPPRRDVDSGLALRADAPDDASCPTGEEPDCWRDGEPPLPGRDVIDALCAAFELDLESCRFVNFGRRPPNSGVDPVLIQTFPGTASPATSTGIDLLNADAGVSMQSLRTPVPIRPSFSSELAAISFNLQWILFASSSNARGEVEPAGSAGSEGICSFLQPQFCSSVQAIFAIGSAQLRPLPDDPFDGSHERWIWEAGAEYEIAAAGGAFSRFAGGQLFALGPERSRVVRVDDLSDDQVGTESAGTTFLLVAPDATETPLVFFAAPEPAGATAGTVALGALAALARQRRAHRLLAGRAAGGPRRTARA